jgi:hypothetical protein
MACSSSLPHRVVVQARALVLAADGVANEAIARECGTTTPRLSGWMTSPSPRQPARVPCRRRHPPRPIRHLHPTS